MSHSSPTDSANTHQKKRATLKGLAIALAACAFALSLQAQEPPAPPSGEMPPAGEMPPSGEMPPAAEATSTGESLRTNTSGSTSEARQGRENRVRRANFDPAEMQTRMLAALREQFGVKDDAEWSLIAERITAIMTLRRSALASSFGGFGGRGGPDGFPGGGNRRNSNANPELEALRSAVSDNLPDAEIKARIERVREMRKQSETKLTTAQEDLRSVLTVRQEAIAIAAGLIP